jgi:chlorite dismutase
MTEPTPKPPRQFVNFLFARVSPGWRLLPEPERQAGKAEFAAVVEEWGGKVQTVPYSLVGIRAETDLLLWRIAWKLEDLQEMAAALRRTGLGRRLETAYSYLAMTRRSIYVDRLDPEHAESRTRIVPGKGRFLFVYPFVKTREWYRQSEEDRQAMMDEHIRTGNRYPSVRLHTTYSYGLDDQEFVVAFETDRPEDFLDLVLELRFSKASAHTLRDTPTFTCVRRSLGEALDLLG